MQTPAFAVLLLSASLWFDPPPSVPPWLHVPPSVPLWFDLPPSAPLWFDLPPSAPLWLDVSPTPQAPRHPWTSFKTGSWVKITYNTRMGAAGANKMSYTMTLLEVTKEKIRIEYEMTNAGVATKNVIEQKPDQDPYKTLTKGETGVETLKIAGKSYRCTWTVYQMDQEQIKGSYKIWTCPSVPGHMVRMEGKYNSGGMDIEYSGEVEEFKVK